MSTPRKKRKSRSKYPGRPPKGSVPLPGGGFATTTSFVQGSGSRARRITITAIRRAEPDLHALARVFIEMAQDKLAREEAERSQAKRAGADAAVDATDVLV